MAQYFMWCFKLYVHLTYTEFKFMAEFEFMIVKFILSHIKFIYSVAEATLLTKPRGQLTSLSY